MARNRKSQSAGARFGPALKAVLLCLLIGGSGVGYVWQKEQIAKLGHQIKLRELRLSALEDQTEQLRKQLSNMRLPQYLEMRIKETHLGLGPPQLGQIMRLPEPVAEPPRAGSMAQYAARTERPAVAP